MAHGKQVDIPKKIHQSKINMKMLLAKVDLPKQAINTEIETQNFSTPIYLSMKIKSGKLQCPFTFKMMHLTMMTLCLGSSGSVLLALLVEIFDKVVHQALNKIKS